MRAAVLGFMGMYCVIATLMLYNVSQEPERVCVPLYNETGLECCQ
jgi:hypothetical protein